LLVDKKILVSGIAMLAVGISISLYLTAIMPIGITGMSDEETLDLILKQRENQDLNTLTGILIAVGFMLVLISFGARRKRKSGAKKVEKKPTTD
jgi:amino acid transporter